MNGINFHLDAKLQLPILGAGIPTMIFGADVTHSPGPIVDGQRTGNSIAAVVGSIDARYATYRCAIRTQSGRKEIIEELEGMAIELMTTFQRRANGRLPERILFYRDGVSEGEFGIFILTKVLLSWKK